MSEGPLAEVEVDDEELLARFIMTERHLPKTGGGVKAEALLPYSRVELSVIRHRDLDAEQLMEIGEEVAVQRRAREQRDFPLLARADFLALAPRQLKLDVVPCEGPELPKNHADVVGWPPDKPAQMSLAQQLAAQVTVVTF